MRKPKDRFSHVTANIMLCLVVTHVLKLINLWFTYLKTSCNDVYNNVVYKMTFQAKETILNHFKF